MRFVGQDQLISYKAEGRVGYELIKPDKSHVMRIPMIITFLSHKINRFVFKSKCPTSSYNHLQFGWVFKYEVASVLSQSNYKNTEN